MPNPIGSCIIVLMLTIVIYLGIYAFDNPDPTDCWYIDGLPQTFLSEYEARQAALQQKLEIPDHEPINVHRVFVIWFTWGFWTIIGPFLVSPLALLFNLV